MGKSLKATYCSLLKTYMMNHFDDTDYDEYSEKELEKYISMITPESQAQTHYRMGLAAKIADAVKSKGWKNQDLAKALNIKSPSLISKWLSGTHNFSVNTLVLIQMVLDIQLLNIKQEDPPDTILSAQANPPSLPVELAKQIHSIKKNLSAKTKNNKPSFTTVNYK